MVPFPALGKLSIEPPSRPQSPDAPLLRTDNMDMTCALVIREAQNEFDVDIDHDGLRPVIPVMNSLPPCACVHAAWMRHARFEYDVEVKALVDGIVSATDAAVVVNDVGPLLYQN